MRPTRENLDLRIRVSDCALQTSSSANIGEELNSPESDQRMEPNPNMLARLSDGKNTGAVIVTMATLDTYSVLPAMGV